MTENAQKVRPQIEVISATAAQAPILANLLELYAHDFSEFHDLNIGEDGRFGYRSLSLTPSAVGPIKAMLLDLDSRKAAEFLCPLIEKPGRAMSIRAQLEKFAATESLQI